MTFVFLRLAYFIGAALYMAFAMQKKVPQTFYESFLISLESLFWPASIIARLRDRS